MTLTHRLARHGLTHRPGPNPTSGKREIVDHAGRVVFVGDAFEVDAWLSQGRPPQQIDDPNGDPMTTATVAKRNTMGGDRPRNADDFYATPPALAAAICRKLRETLPAPYAIVEPSAGDGSFVRAAADVWPTCPIFAYEPHQPLPSDPDAPGIWTAMRWEDVPPNHWPLSLHGGTLILGNPPYRLAESHVRIALDRLGHGTLTAPAPRYLAFLLRASFLAGDRRARGLHLATGGLRYVWHVTPRPSFTNDGRTDGAEYAVCVWQAGHRGPYEGGWLTWRGEP